MKKNLLLLFMVSCGYLNAQVLQTQGFDLTTAALVTAGWQITNVSEPLGTGAWSIPYDVPTASSSFGGLARAGHAGGANSFALVNYTSTTGAGLISNWLISPNITVQNGDVVSFWSRKGTDSTTDYPDRLEVRVSSAATTLVPTTAASVGSFTTLGVSVNPTLLGAFLYPKVWTQYSFTVSGLTGQVPVKIGFRYFVSDGGPAGANSDIIGIDTFSVSRPLSTSDFFAQNFKIFPNPATTSIQISSTQKFIETIEISDINARVLKTVSCNDALQMNVDISDLSTGVYFLKVKSNEGIGSAKFLKQ